MNYEYCRKTKYKVSIELGCYKIDENNPLIEGFEEKYFNDEKYAVKKGINILEGNNWETSPSKPYIVTGTVGERWTIKPSNLSAYDVDPNEIGINPISIYTKDPSSQKFMVAVRIPIDKQVVVIPSYAYDKDGNIIKEQVLTSNLLSSSISHLDGDYVIAKEVEGRPSYMDLPDEIRNTKEMSKMYEPRIINGSIMEKTYDHAKTKEEIIKKYDNKVVEPTMDDSFNKEEQMLIITENYNAIVDYFYRNPTSTELPPQVDVLLTIPNIDSKSLIIQAQQTGIAKYNAQNQSFQEKIEEPTQSKETITQDIIVQESSSNNVKGYARVWILGILTFSASIGIFILGMLLTR